MIGFTAIAVACVFTAAPPATAATTRPNIVLIMADDMGFSDLGCYGSEIATPNLDRLAAQGVRFTQFYNNARCCPTRATLLTGLYPHQAGVGHMNDQRDIPAYQGRLNDQCVTIAEVLRAAGYHTLMSGKWHVGNTSLLPAHRGFELSFVGIWGSFNYFRSRPRDWALNDQILTIDEDKFYTTDAITDRALGFLDQVGRKPEPFFLYVAYNAPHWPLHAWPDDIAKYRGKHLDGWQALRERRYRKQIELGLIKPEWALTPQDPEAPDWNTLSEARKDRQDLRQAIYCAQIDRLDQGIGKLLVKLADLGIRDNTLIMFLADNGGCAERIERGKPGAALGTADSYASYGLPWANASNTPFRLYKHWVHEGGISTPFIAHWPAVIRKPEMTSQTGHILDVMATCVDVSGAKYPATYRGHAIAPLEGQSLAPIFRGQTRKGHDALFWEHEGNKAVRQGKWKLASRHPDQWELYDLDADRTELHNLADKNPQKVAELSALYDAWAKRAGVVPWGQLPKAKPPADRPY